MSFDMVRDTEHHRKPYTMPMPLQAKVCMCQEPGPPLFDTNKRVVIATCNVCLKPYRWNVRICTVCKKHFIKDFRRKADDCVKHTKCWDCMLNSDTCPCDKEQTTRPDYGPLGLNPRVFTSEELADIKPPF